jgi:hypothetical protein
MKGVLVPTFALILLCSLVKAGDTVTWHDLYGRIGFITSDGRYVLDFDVGIEQWEDGKQTTHRNQQWTLDCSSPSATGQESTVCTLKRLVIDKELTPGSGPILNVHKHSTLDGTLKIVLADWNRGRLDFTIINSDNSVTEAMLEMKISSSLILLNSFKATAITRGNIVSIPLTTIEYKIPKYTYTANVPILMRGLRPMSEKKWDEGIATLSKHDQSAWEDFKGKLSSACKNLEKMSPDEIIKKATIVEARRVELRKGGTPSKDEKTRIISHVESEWAQCLKKSKMTEAGQRTIVEIITKEL